MYIQAKVLRLFDIQTGQSARGSWKKRDFLVETIAKLPRKINLSLRGEAVDQFKFNVGDALKISIDIESREYNNRWYTEVKAWKIEPFTEEDSYNANSFSDEDSPF